MKIKKPICTKKETGIITKYPVLKKMSPKNLKPKTKKK